MDLKHPEGYWVQQLTDDNIRDLLDIIVSSKKFKKFKKVISQERTENMVSILYASIKTNCYLNYCEDKLIINDYKISGQHPYLLYYEFMINLFGEEYANDFLAYAENYIAENPEDKWSTRLEKIKVAIPAIVDSYNHSLKNEL